ncbi:hypothetical protein [Nonomuraea sp. NPDC003804]|uniref:hypothetical protein n=1 Tax=Nonomuraea sp. NPDC003804 TaxID=3154547 RepID=UPI0033B650CE
MRSVLLAVTAWVALVPAVPAHAAPDPVKALTAQLASGKGVMVSATIKTAKNGKTYLISYEKGKVALAPRGVVATDKTLRHRYLGKMDEDDKAIYRPSRQIVIGKTVYHRGGIWADLLPAGKSWMVRKGFGPSSTHSSIEVLDPRQLRILLDHATVRRDGMAEGVTTTCQLDGLREATCPYKDDPKITWTLWFNSKGLITRLVSANDLKLSQVYRTHVDVRFTGWGSTVVIDPPSADQVWDPQEEDTPPDILGESNS